MTDSMEKLNAEALADAVERDVQFLANHAKGFSLMDWNRVSNNMLEAARRLRSGALIPAERGWRSDMEKQRRAILAALGFIKNGIEVGYIQMPDDEADPAHATVVQLEHAAEITPPGSDTPDQPDRVAELEGENRRLREALEPFAVASKKFEKRLWDDDDIAAGGHLMVGDLRRAASLTGEDG